MNTFICYMESTLMVKSETFRINDVEQLIKRKDIKPMIYDVGGYKSIYEVRRFSLKHHWICLPLR